MVVDGVIGEEVGTDGVHVGQTFGKTIILGIRLIMCVSEQIGLEVPRYTMNQRWIFSSKAVERVVNIVVVLGDVFQTNKVKILTEILLKYVGQRIGLATQTEKIY